MKLSDDERFLVASFRRCQPDTQKAVIASVANRAATQASRDLQSELKALASKAMASRRPRRKAEAAS